jgi:hypothetical protein
MAAPSGMFCEHKRLRTSCPTCRPPPPPPPVPKAKAPRSAAPNEVRAGSASEPAEFRATGPGKPLMPKRKPRNKAVSADEAASADAWWVKKS